MSYSNDLDVIGAMYDQNPSDDELKQHLTSLLLMQFESTLDRIANNQEIFDKGMNGMFGAQATTALITVGAMTKPSLIPDRVTPSVKAAILALGVMGALPELPVRNAEDGSVELVEIDKPLTPSHRLMYEEIVDIINTVYEIKMFTAFVEVMRSVYS